MPITLCFGSYDMRRNFLLKTKSASIDLDGNMTSAWIKINVDQTGFYRVKYDEPLQAKLRYAIEKKLLSGTDRFGNFAFSSTVFLVPESRSLRLTCVILLTGIIDDSYALCMARHQSLTSLLTLMAAYREEEDYTVLSNLISVC